MPAFLAPVAARPQLAAKSSAAPRQQSRAGRCARAAAPCRAAAKEEASVATSPRMAGALAAALIAMASPLPALASNGWVAPSGYAAQQSEQYAEMLAKSKGLPYTAPAAPVKKQVLPVKLQKADPADDPTLKCEVNRDGQQSCYPKSTMPVTVKLSEGTGF